MKRTISCIIIMAFFFTSEVSATLSSANADPRNGTEPISVFEYLTREDVLEIQIKTDLGRLLENKYNNAYIPAYMEFNDGEDLKEWRVEIRPRGKYRRRVCDFPPLKVKFDHSVLGPDNLMSYKSLKLVTHCSDIAEQEELLNKEYLAYKLYNEITDKSFKVQIARIQWIDLADSIQMDTKWAFFIENEDEMAERIGGRIYDQYGAQQDDLCKESAANHSVFQYMIGNSDWDVSVNRNIKLVKTYSTKELIVVPYDFDFSGLIDAPYAVADKKYSLNNIQERIYLGQSDEEDITQALEAIEEKKKDVLDLVAQSDYASRTHKNAMKKYLKDFFSSTEDIRYPEYYYDRLSKN